MGMEIYFNGCLRLTYHMCLTYSRPTDCQPPSQLPCAGSHNALTCWAFEAVKVGRDCNIDIVKVGVYKTLFKIRLPVALDAVVQARRNFQLLQVPQFIDAIACLATEIAEEECQLDPQLHDSSAS